MIHPVNEGKEAYAANLTGSLVTTYYDGAGVLEREALDLDRAVG